MQRIPLSALPAQTFSVVLDQQNCVMSLYTRGKRLFLDLTAGGHAVCRGAICQDGADVLQSGSPHFSGTLHFVDTRGRSGPAWKGLDERYAFLYRPAGQELPERLKH